MILRYIAIPAETSSRESDQAIRKLLVYIDNGYEILSAVGVAAGVHYIIGKPSNDELLAASDVPVLPKARKTRKLK